MYINSNIVYEINRYLCLFFFFISPDAFIIASFYSIYIILTNVSLRYVLGWNGG